jgi:putative inorganic carbon (HCO3(-)) transporter
VRAAAATRALSPGAAAGVATAGALALAAAIAVRSGTGDGYLALAVLAAAAGGALLAAALEPAVTISAGLVLSVSSGHFANLGSPIGIDRVVLVTGIAAVIVRDLRSEAPRLRVRPIDLLLAAIAVFAALSALFAGTLRSNDPFFSLLDYLGIIPFLLFWTAPAAFGSAASRRILLGTLVGLGLYLGITAILETIGPRALIFPRYILDPGVGLHIGRARGPFAEAAANGLAMVTCGVAAAVMLAGRARRVLPVAAIVLCAVGVVFTLTRQVWLAAGAGIALTMLARRELRAWLAPAAAIGVVGVLAIIIVVPGFTQRAQSRLDDNRPVWDRLNSNAATLRMIGERPLAGFGWGMFPQRSKDFYRLAPDRPLTTVGRPHNVFLANGAELGVLALLAWVGALAVAIGGALRRRGPPDLDAWRTGLIAVAVAWVVVANFTPMGYAFCHAILWLWAGICWSRE